MLSIENALCGGRKSTGGGSYERIKVLDVALKACVDSCRLPDETTARRVRALLHAAIDTSILNLV